MTTTNDSQIPSMELPNVTPESSQGGLEQTQAVPTTETGVAQALEQGVSQPVPPAAQPAFDMNLGPQPAVSTTFDPSQMTPAQPVPTASAMPIIADDNDLIEKEWVEKAKQIVEHTKADPHIQNKEMNRVKADYLKKRYNKDVKLVDE